MADVPLEDLIRRYESGDRDPDLILQLNEAAWDGFHDPWEPSLKERIEAFKATVAVERGTGPPVTPFDPEALQPFTPGTIRRFLEGRNYKFWSSSWDSFLIFWRYSIESDRVVRAAFCVEGKQKDIFKLRIVGDRRVPCERFDVARQLCNAWNEEYRWPRAYLENPDLTVSDREALDGREPASATLALDFQLFMPTGISQVAFDIQVKDVLSASWSFWELARNDYDL